MKLEKKDAEGFDTLQNNIITIWEDLWFVFVVYNAEGGISVNFKDDHAEGELSIELTKTNSNEDEEILILNNEGFLFSKRIEKFKEEGKK